MTGRSRRIELYRLPPYSPNYNPTEGAWKETQKRVTHNRFFHTVEERNCACSRPSGAARWRRNSALVATFESFKANPEVLAGQVRRFLG